MLSLERIGLCIHILLGDLMKKTLFIFTIAAIVLSACSATTTVVPEPTKPVPATQTPIPTATSTTVPEEKKQSGQITIVCSNTLSDAETINAAIEGSQVGDEIVISGTCIINDSIKLLGDRSYRGTSRTGTILKQADGANLSGILITDTYLENRDWTGTPVFIGHMTLDGNSKMNPGSKTDGIILRSWLSVVDDMLITDMSQDGIKVAYKSENGTDLTTGQVNGRISGNLIDRSGRYGVYVEFHVTDWNLIDNWIAFSGADGLHMEDASGWVVERNHIYGVPHNAIYADHLWGSTISDNFIEGFGETSDAGTWYGIYATIQAGVASTISNNRIFNFANNGSRNPNSSYRYIGITLHDTGVVAVTSNTLRGMNIGNETGLYYTAAGNDRGTVISAFNYVADVASDRTVDSAVKLSEGY